jgi:nucleoid-associated protein YgaU
LQSNTGRDAIMAAIDPSEGDSRAASSRNVLMQIPNSRTTVAGNPAIGTESRATERGQHALGNDKSEEETSDSVMPSDDANLESSLTPEATVLDAGQEQELERGPLTRQQLSVNSQGNARTQLSPHSSQFPAAEPVIESIPDRELDPNPFVPAGSAEPSSQSDSGRRAGFPLAREQSELGFRTYEVREGDSFWTISARFYGTGKHFRTLEQLNADRLSSAGGRMILRPGTEILLPDLATLRSHKPAGSAAAAGVELPSNVSKDSLRTGGSQLKPQAAGGRGDGFEASSRSDSSSTGRTYRVREADTLSTIAERLLGSAKRWEEIYQLNQQQLSDPNRLIPGMELQIPAGRTPEKIADRLPEGR